MARTPARKKIPDEPAKPVLATIAVSPNEFAQSYYCNYLEVAQTAYDFTIYGIKVPAKLDAANLVTLKDGGKLNFLADIEITFPAHIIDGLITALTTQRDIFERNMAEIKERNSRSSGDVT